MGNIGYSYYYDPTMLIILPALLFSMYASWKVSSALRNNSAIANKVGISGAEVARRLLDRQGLSEVAVVETDRGDHYDPTRRVVCLSGSIARGSSLASLGVAAHEVGHAIQHQQSYTPLSLRSGFFPVANFGSMASWPLIILGMMLGIPALISAGIVVFSLVVLFQIITLPVEYNASSRAMQMLIDNGYVDRKEEKAVRSVLDAAAMTYVAAVATSVLTLLRYIMLSKGSRRRR